MYILKKSERGYVYTKHLTKLYQLLKVKKYYFNLNIIWILYEILPDKYIIYKRLYIKLRAILCGISKFQILSKTKSQIIVVYKISLVCVCVSYFILVFARGQTWGQHLKQSFASSDFMTGNIMIKKKTQRESIKERDSEINIHDNKRDVYQYSIENLELSPKRALERITRIS